MCSGVVTQHHCLELTIVIERSTLPPYIDNTARFEKSGLFLAATCEQKVFERVFEFKAFLRTRRSRVLKNLEFKYEFKQLFAQAGSGPKKPDFFQSKPC